MIRTPRALAPLVLCSSLALAQQAPPAAGGHGAPTPSYPVLQVIAADAVLVRIKGKPTRVWLRGLAPVPGVPGDAYRKLAREYLTGLLKGQAVRLEVRPGRVADTPTVLYRESDGVSVNLRLIRDGYAALGKGLGDEQQEEAHEAERAARAGRFGLWGRATSAGHDRARAGERERAERIEEEKPGVPPGVAEPFDQARADLISDVAADFSRTSNPNGVWRYGWSFTLGSSFILSTDRRVREGLDTWRGDRAADGNTGAYHNGTGGPIILNGSARYEPGQFGLHPGPAGEYAVVRYTAPKAGQAFLTSRFIGQDFFGTGTTTDVYVLLNGRTLLNGLVEGFGSRSAVPFSTSLAVLPGDTIDFAVGFGRNRTFGHDSTALAATITLVP
jgi:endonuclease YncB( thermonuclease family)